MTQRQFWGIAALAALVIGSVAPAARAQGSANNTGSTGSAFLSIGVGARAMGMAGAVATLPEDPSTLYWNPAGIAGLDAFMVSAEHTEYVADMVHDFFGAVVPLTDRFRLGLSVIRFSSGDIEITTIEQPRGTGATYTVGDLALGGTLGWAVTNSILVGVTLKYVRNDLYDLTADGIAFDMGAMFDTGFNSLRVAFSVVNLGADREYRGSSLDFQYPPPYPGAEPIRASFTNIPFSLPLAYRAGVSAEVFELLGSAEEHHLLNLAVDLAQPSEGPEKVNLGGEYAYDRMFFLRGGYVFNADELGLMAGGGVHLLVSGVGLDVNYAFASVESFSAIHRIGVGVSF